MRVSLILEVRIGGVLALYDKGKPQAIYRPFTERDEGVVEEGSEDWESNCVHAFYLRKLSGGIDSAVPCGKGR